MLDTGIDSYGKRTQHNRHNCFNVGRSPRHRGASSCSVVVSDQRFIFVSAKWKKPIVSILVSAKSGSTKSENRFELSGGRYEEDVRVILNGTPKLIFLLFICFILLLKKFVLDTLSDISYNSITASLCYFSFRMIYCTPFFFFFFFLRYCIRRVRLNY